MNGNCHFVFGASVGASVSLMCGLSSAETTLLISTCLIGAIFPDIDNPTSNMGQLSKPISTVIGKVGRVFGKSGKNHRGIFHDPFFYIIGAYLSYLYFPPLLGFFLGAFTHLFLDMFNPSGIRFLGVKFLRLAKIPSGSKESVAFTWIATILVLFVGLYNQGVFTNDFFQLL